MHDQIENEYFEWMTGLVHADRFSGRFSYDKLLMLLHSVEFTPTIRRDNNRAQDGVDLRYRFILMHNYDERVLGYLQGPCSVLEMMVALAVRCEETIMDDPEFGDRTGQWFWGMVRSLGLGSMSNAQFDKAYSLDVIERFLKREYSPEGVGGLFTIKGIKRDLSTMEIWYQLCQWIDRIT